MKPDYVEAKVLLERLEQNWASDSMPKPT